MGVTEFADLAFARTPSGSSLPQSGSVSTLRMQKAAVIVHSMNAGLLLCMILCYSLCKWLIVASSITFWFCSFCNLSEMAVEENQD